MAKNKKELQPTRGTVKFVGQVVGLENENTFRTGVTKNGEGYPFRSVSLAIKTSPTNIVYNIDNFGQDNPDQEVTIFSNKKDEKEKRKIKFEDRHELPAGFTPFGFGTIRLGFDKDTNGKLIFKNLFSYDAIERIKETLNEGDTVFINGSFKPETYNSNGEDKTTVKYNLESIGLSKNPVEFEDENFKEVSSFEQEMVVVDVSVDKENKKVYVTGRLIKYNKIWDDIVFIVDAKEQEQFATNVAKKLKFGDLIKAQGIIINGVILEEQKAADAFDWGGEEPEGQKKFIKTPISELRITNIKEHSPKEYKELDFEIDEDPFKDSSSDSPFGESEEDDNPFA